MECKCDLRTKLVGDGCQVCNPEYSEQFVQQSKDELYDLCKKFIEDQRIYCAETISQTDRVIENAYDFIYEICELVGYHDE